MAAVQAAARMVEGLGIEVRGTTDGAVSEYRVGVVLIHVLLWVHWPL